MPSWADSCSGGGMGSPGSHRVGERPGATAWADAPAGCTAGCGAGSSRSHGPSPQDLPSVITCVCPRCPTCWGGAVPGAHRKVGAVWAGAAQCSLQLSSQAVRALCGGQASLFSAPGPDTLFLFPALGLQGAPGPRHPQPTGPPPRRGLCRALHFCSVRPEPAPPCRARARGLGLSAFHLAPGLAACCFCSRGARRSLAPFPSSEPLLSACEQTKVARPQTLGSQGRPHLCAVG